jgi:hypothetical protein
LGGNDVTDTNVVGAYAGTYPLDPDDQLPGYGAACVYLLHDASGATLYAGSTEQVAKRLRMHAAWFRRVHEVDLAGWSVLHLDTGAAMRDLERRTIDELRPAYNGRLRPEGSA